MFKKLALILLATVVAASTHTRCAPSHVSQILERVNNANEHRDHVMIVAHRGGWMVGGKIIIAENSIQAVERAIELGAEFIEIDVRMTADGTFVVLHDSTLDRTTTCTGAIAEQTFDQVKDCKLVIEGTGEVTEEVLPTLEAIMIVAKDRILINLDTKVDIAEVEKIFELGRAMGMDEQLLATAASHTPEQLQAAVAVREALGGDVNLMPNIYDARIVDTNGLDQVEDALIALEPTVLQTRNQQEVGMPITKDGGLMYSFRAISLAVKYNVHLWINTLYSYGDPATTTRSGGYRGGGRGDELAVLANMPHEAFGFWAETGATIIQTDEPEACINYLEANGYRKPYL